MNTILIGQQLAPAEGEVTVRTYHCTCLSSIFSLVGLKTNGYLTISNKRVVYFAEGQSLFGLTGNSKLYSEIPIADISTLAFGKGTRFSFLRFLLALWVIGPLGSSIFGGIGVGILHLLFGTQRIIDPYLVRLSIFLLLNIACIPLIGSLWVPKESIYRLLFVSGGAGLFGAMATMPGGLPSVTKLIMSNSPTLYVSILGLVYAAIAIYWFYCLYWFCRRQYVTMDIRAKGTIFTPIAITAISWFSRKNVTAQLASHMAPAADADIMFKEVGAIVSDLQVMGDHAVQKWQSITPFDSTEMIKAKHIAALRYRRTILRYAVLVLALIAISMGTESGWYTYTARRQAALDVKTWLVAAKAKLQHDPSTDTLVPKMWQKAQFEEQLGADSFEKHKFMESVNHWSTAINVYTNIPLVVESLKLAQTEQVRYEQSISLATREGLIFTGNMATDFYRLMDHYSNPDWVFVKESTARAKQLVEKERWKLSGFAWDSASDKLPVATQVMHADIWVEKAQAEISAENWLKVWECSTNALGECPMHLRASQLKEIASNILNFRETLESEVHGGRVNAAAVPELIAQLDLYGGTDWFELKNIAAETKALAEQNKWTDCLSRWSAAKQQLPHILLTVRIEKMESEARKGNWADVAKLAQHLLEEQPSLTRAQELKDLASSIIEAQHAELNYKQVFIHALDREANEGRIKAGDMTAFIHQMDRYGQDDWAEVKMTLNKALEQMKNEKGHESLAAWKLAGTKLPLAVQRMHAEMWLENAEAEVTSNNWAKVLIYSQNALREYPNIPRARQLRDQANLIEEARAAHLKFDQLYQKAMEHNVQMDFGDLKNANTNGFNKLLKLYGGEQWRAVQDNVNKATMLGEEKRSQESLAAWSVALQGFPSAIRQMHTSYWSEQADIAAKKWSWQTVDDYADDILMEDPQNEHAKQLKIQANLAKQIQAAQIKFGLMQTQAMEQEYRAGVRGLKAGDSDGFYKLLDRYAGESWHSVNVNAEKAKALATQLKLDESLAVWVKAIGGFPAAIKNMRAGFWLEKTELAAKMGAWEKVSVFSDNVLIEDPDNIRATQLKTEAEKKLK